MVKILPRVGDLVRYSTWDTSEYVEVISIDLVDNSFLGRDQYGNEDDFIYDPSLFGPTIDRYWTLVGLKSRSKKKKFGDFIKRIEGKDG